MKHNLFTVAARPLRAGLLGLAVAGLAIASPLSAQSKGKVATGTDAGTSSLNRQQAEAASAQNAANAASAQEVADATANYRAAVDSVAVARANYEAEMARYRAAQAEHAAAQAAFEAAHAQWEADVRACRAGDRSKCDRAAPQR